MAVLLRSVSGSLARGRAGADCGAGQSAGDWRGSGSKEITGVELDRCIYYTRREHNKHGNRQDELSGTDPFINRISNRIQYGQHIIYCMYTFFLLHSIPHATSNANTNTNIITETNTLITNSSIATTTAANTTTATPTSFNNSCSSSRDEERVLYNQQHFNRHLPTKLAPSFPLALLSLSDLRALFKVLTLADCITAQAAPRAPAAEFAAQPVCQWDGRRSNNAAEKTEPIRIPGDVVLHASASDTSPPGDLLVANRVSPSNFVRQVLLCIRGLHDQLSDYLLSDDLLPMSAPADRRAIRRSLTTVEMGAQTGPYVIDIVLTPPNTSMQPAAGSSLRRSWTAPIGALG